MPDLTRRDALKALAAGAMLPGSLLGSKPSSAATIAMTTNAPRLRFGVVGINHSHIYGMVDAVVRGGGELASVFVKEPDLLAEFTKKYPSVKVARSEAEVLEDPSIKLVLSSIVPAERAPLGIRVMQHGKDFMADKPG